MENDLREAVQGPDHSWLLDARAGPPWVHSTSQCDHPEALKRQTLIDEVQDSGVLDKLQETSGYLKSH
eukprot:7639727-Pyramimonas_sp.AAC.1